MTEPHLTLPSEGRTSSAAVTFGDAIPGVYEPDVPVPLSAIGLTVEEAAEAIDAHGLPLVLDAEGLPAAPEPASGGAEPTLSELRAELRELGLPDRGSKAELIERLAEARAGGGEGDEL